MRVLNLLPDVETHARFEVTEEERPLNDEEFFEFCARNPGLRIEREANGEIIIMPPAGGETGYRNNEMSRQLGNWAWPTGVAAPSIPIRSIFFLTAPPFLRTLPGC